MPIYINISIEESNGGLTGKVFLLTIAGDFLVTQAGENLIEE